MAKTFRAFSGLVFTPPQEVSETVYTFLTKVPPNKYVGKSFDDSKYDPEVVELLEKNSYNSISSIEKTHFEKTGEVVHIDPIDRTQTRVYVNPERTAVSPFPTMSFDVVPPNTKTNTGGFKSAKFNYLTPYETDGKTPWNSGFAVFKRSSWTDTLTREWAILATLNEFIAHTEHTPNLTLCEAIGENSFSEKVHDVFNRGAFVQYEHSLALEKSLSDGSNKSVVRYNILRTLAERDVFLDITGRKLRIALDFSQKKKDISTIDHQLCQEFASLRKTQEGWIELLEQFVDNLGENITAAPTLDFAHSGNVRHIFARAFFRAQSDVYTHLIREDGSVPDNFLQNLATLNCDIREMPEKNAASLADFINLLGVDYFLNKAKLSTIFLIARKSPRVASSYVRVSTTSASTIISIVSACVKNLDGENKDYVTESLLNEFLYSVDLKRGASVNKKLLEAYSPGTPLTIALNLASIEFTPVAERRSSLGASKAEDEKRQRKALEQLIRAGV